jgi:DNA polymerase
LEPRFSVPQDFIDLAEKVICHRDPSRFALLYRILWRLKDEPRLLHIVTDPDVARARDMAKSVSLASHKMTAFVRFREIEDEEGERYVAWFEPAHRVLPRTASFFVRRFATLRFSILTPDGCAHWDGRLLTFTPGVDRSAAPADDELEDFWRTYYASIFNPARLKVKAMQAEMPKKYWRNLPEASLIPELIAKASERSEAMVHAQASPPRKGARVARPARVAPAEGAVPPNLPAIAEMIQSCRRCDLYACATQGVPGEGPGHARLMLVGEQPGDQEDLAGKPFVGPAGQMLDRAMEEAGVPRREVYVTNAVKHFKNEARGKRRLHKTPDGGEVAACRWWLEHERGFVRPRLILALGGTAALSVLGKATPIAKSRGQLFQLPDQSQAMVTMHPSYLLRIPDREAKAEAYARFVEDLAQAWRYAA